MIDLNSPELSFRTGAQVRAYCSFFLGTNPLEVPAELTQEEEADLQYRREARLVAQLDHFKKNRFFWCK